MTPRSYDAVVVGAGHNGLVTAAYLAKGGLTVLVLERRDVVGGAAVTEEFHPGFRIDTAAHVLPDVDPALLEDLGLARHGLEVARPDPVVFAPQLDGRHLLLWRDQAASVRSITPFSARDAGQWSGFCSRLAKTAEFVRALNTSTLPRVPDGRLADLWHLLRTGYQLRRHGRSDMLKILRILPMSVAELLDEWFESDVLKGVLAARAVSGLFQGPMAAGTAYLLSAQYSPNDGCPSVGLVRGGMGRFTEALASAARALGVEIRTSAPVERVIVRDGRARGVVLESGEEIRAQRTVSNADPRRTFLDLVGPSELDPEFLRMVRNIKFRSAAAKVHLALDALPDFTALGGSADHLRGVTTISPSIEYLERAYDDAKYGRLSEKPYLEVVIPSLTDPTLAPQGKHVASIFVQYAPYRLDAGDWDSRRRAELGDAVLATLEQYAPGISSLVLARQVMTPRDYEERFFLTEGNPSHGEMTLDQLMFMRPVPGWAQYRAPVAALYLCGAGTHPGGGVTGLPGRSAAREIVKDVKRGR